MKLRYRGLFLPALLSLVATAAAVPGMATASAASATVDCTSAEVVMDIQPGLTPSPGPNTFTGQDGEITCSGTVDGQTVDSAVPGVLAVAASSPSASCVAIGEGDGTFDLAVTTTAGTVVHTTGSFTWSGQAGQVSVTGDLTADGTIQPLNGDCVTEPVTSGLGTLPQVAIVVP